MNETNVVEAAADGAAKTEQKEAKEAKGEERGLDQANATVQLQTEEEKTAEAVRAEEQGGRVNVEEELPESLKQSRARATRQEHPAGEAFFRGNTGEVSDAEAEEVARKQLERSGLLRGQRVRVGD